MPKDNDRKYKMEKHMTITLICAERDNANSVQTYTKWNFTLIKIIIPIEISIKTVVIGKHSNIMGYIYVFQTSVIRL